jgi:hypothetical protein
VLASAIVFSFQSFLAVRESALARTFELADPALSDLVDRYGIDEVQLLAAPPLNSDEVSDERVTTSSGGWECLALGGFQISRTLRRSLPA